jgi:uncharacterized protein YciU (UPF0263 family)
MVMVVKSEWHQVEKRYGVEIDRDLFGEIYSDIEDEAEIDLMYLQFEAGELDVGEVIDKAWDEDIDIDWDWLDEDDWWTDRKGGYDVTYEVVKG